MLAVRSKDDASGAPVSLVPSRYNQHAIRPDGSLIIANMLSGSCIVVGKDDAGTALELLRSESDVDLNVSDSDIETFRSAGFLVPKTVDEIRKVRYLQSHVTSRADHQQLILLPTEQCNFRCVYCYESFTEGEMNPDVRNGVKHFIKKRVRSLNSLSIDWFGGEPLLAYSVIADLMPYIRDETESHGCKLNSHITTNAFLLTEEVSSALLAWGVNSFQITIDGPRSEHNKRRRIHNPGTEPCVGSKSTASLPILQDSTHACQEPDAGTFDQIMSNVAALLRHRRYFQVCLRTNYDMDSLPSMPRFIKELAELFGSDPRVRVDFCPIWGEPGQATVSLPTGGERQRTMTSLFESAHSAGLRSGLLQNFEPGGTVCYAAKANSLVIRSNGDLNKCTVALESAYNKVGRLLPDGSVEIDIDKFAKWTNSGLETDSTCQTCRVAPACQGNACPLERFENGRRPCPVTKGFGERLVQLVI